MVLCAVLAWFGVVSIAPPPDNFELEWQAPMACPQGLEVERATARILGRDPGSGSDLVRATAVVVEREAGFTLDLEIATPGGRSRRRMEAERCETLVNAAALVLAVAVDPLAALSATDPGPTEPEPEPEREREREPGPVDGRNNDGRNNDGRNDPVPPVRRRGAHGILGVAVAAEGSALPNAGAGFELRGGVRFRPRLRVEGYVTYWIPRTLDFDSGSARLWMWTAGARVCAEPKLGPVEFPACLAGEGGLVHGRGRSLETNLRSAQPWAAMLVGPGLAWPFHPRVRLTVAIDLVAVLVRPGFEVSNQGTVYRAPRAGIRGALGLEFGLFRGPQRAPMSANMTP